MASALFHALERLVSSALMVKDYAPVSPRCRAIWIEVYRGLRQAQGVLVALLIEA